MIFSTVKHNQNSELSIQNVYIEKVPSITFLGVIIDQQLNWKEYIDSVKAKLYCNIVIEWSYCLNVMVLYNYCVLIL